MKSITFATPLTPNENKSLKDKLSVKIANNIKQIRIDRNMTQQEVSEKAGLHLTYLGHLEVGKYHPSTFVLWKIAKVLQVSVDTIIN